MRLIILFVCLSFSTQSFSDYKLELIKDDLDIVWGIDFINADTMIVTEKSGNLKKIDLKTMNVTNISGAPKVYSKGQGGLLDIKKHPDFIKNKRVYISYSKEVENGQTTALGFGTLNNNKLENFKDIFIALGEAKGRIHFGSRITFDEKNQIFLSIGERGNRENAQNLENHFGKTIRIADDGSIPKDNPFVGMKNRLSEIWSYGHRNPQGLVYDLKSKQLFEMEHGPRGGDEINVIKKGRNYGWPIQSYGSEYMLPLSVGEEKVKGVEQPFKFYDPSIAPCGLIYYEGERYPEFKKSLISGALKLTHLNIVNIETKKEIRLFEEKNLRIRSVSVSPDDYIYISTDGGKIFKVLLKK